VDSVNQPLEKLRFCGARGDSIEDLYFWKISDHYESLIEKFAASALVDIIGAEFPAPADEFGGMEFFSYEYAVCSLHIAPMLSNLLLYLPPLGFVNYQSREATNTFISRIIDINKKHVEKSS
jgi:hypothetical protein